MVTIPIYLNWGFLKKVRTRMRELKRQRVVPAKGVYTSDAPDLRTAFHTALHIAYGVNLQRDPLQLLLFIRALGGLESLGVRVANVRSALTSSDEKAANDEAWRAVDAAWLGLMQEAVAMLPFYVRWGLWRRQRVRRPCAVTIAGFQWERVAPTPAQYELAQNNPSVMKLDLSADLVDKAAGKPIQYFNLVALRTLLDRAAPLMTEADGKGIPEDVVDLLVAAFVVDAQRALPKSVRSPIAAS